MKALGSLMLTALWEEPQPFVQFTDEPKVPGYLTFPSESAKRKYTTSESFGQGFDTDRARARLKSVAEFHERLCLYNPLKDRFTDGVEYSGGAFVDPAAFFCYSEEQVPERGKAIDGLRREKYAWFPVADMLGGSAMLPAQRIFLSNFSDEVAICRETTSNGAAFGEAGSGRAFANGLLELIERDACMHAYLSKRPLRRITGMPDGIAELEEYLRRYRLEPYIFDVDTGLGVPAAMTITVDMTGIGPAITAGSGADFTYAGAICHSIFESIQCRSHARFTKEMEFPAGTFPVEEGITDLRKRMFYWSNPERIADLGFWLGGSLGVEYARIERELSVRDILEALQAKGFHAYKADITLPEIKAAGFEVVKVIVPEFHQLYLDERAKALYSAYHGAIPDDNHLKPHPLT